MLTYLLIALVVVCCATFDCRQLPDRWTLRARKSPWFAAPATGSRATHPGNTMPILAGMNAHYFKKAIKDYADGKRPRRKWNRTRNTFCNWSR